MVTLSLDNGDAGDQATVPHALPLLAQPDLTSQIDAVERDGYVYLLFDDDVCRAIRPAGPLDSPEQIDGPAIETLLVYQERRTAIAYRSLKLDLTLLEHGLRQGGRLHCLRRRRLVRH